MSDSTQQDTLFEPTGKKVTVWVNTSCDGSRDSDATDGYGCVSKDEDSGTINMTSGRISYKRHCTSQVTKYRAIIAGIEWVCNEYSSVGKLQVFSDGQTPVEQISGNNEVNHHHLQKLKREALRLLSEFDEWHVTWQAKTQSSEIRQATELAEEAVKGGSA